MAGIVPGFVQRFLKTPAFSDPQQDLAARQVFSIVRAFIFSSVFLQIVQIAIAPRITARWLALLFATLAVSWALLELNRRGYVRTASWLLVLSLWLLIGVFAWTASGLGARAAYGYFIVAFIAGMVLGKWPGIVTAVVCSGSTLLIALAGPVRSNDPYRFWLVNSLYLAIVLLLQNLAGRSIREALDKTGSELRERLLAQAALSESEQRHRELINSLPFCVFEADLQGNFTFVNQTALEWFGYSREEFLAGLNIAQVLAEGEVPRARENLGRIALGEEIFIHEYEARRKDGSIFTALIRSRPIFAKGVSVGVQGSLIDISARKQAEQDREQVISLLRATVESTTDGILVIDPGKRIAHFNRRFVEMWGIPEEIMASGDDDRALAYVSGQLTDPQGFADKVQSLYSTPLAESFDLLEFKDGRFFERYSRPQMLGGRPVGRVWSFRDISERKRSEMALKESEYRYRMLFEASSDSIFVMKEDRFFDCNSRTLEMYGCTREQIIGTSPDQFSPPLQPDGRRSREKAQEKIRAAYAGQPQFFEWTHIRADGTPFIAEVSLTRIDLAADVFLLAMVRDISERKQLEEQLLQAQKMEAIGILAGGVAHDFNNILSTIVGYGSLLQMKLPPDDPQKEYVERILAASERAANLTGSLLTFSRKQEAELLPVELNDALDGFHKVLARLIGEDIDLRLEPADRSLVVAADVRQIEQVLMNLVNNSRDAMPRGGRLTIATAAVTVDTDNGSIPRGDYAAITVSDTGTGMDKEIQARIFEPFFTTKEIGKGTGLGLAIAYGIVKKHSGFISVSSVPGQGTTVTVHLPLSSFPGQDPRRSDEERIPGGSETILLVEDDEAVRQVTRSMLVEFGYTVLEAGDGASAMEIFLRERERIALVLCDLIMPRRNGRETLAAIHKLKADVKAIFMSGYTADIIAGKGIADSGFHLLLKPLSPGTLLKKVRDVLDGG